jgi:Spy/CpxP family protein refolding chaperone
LAPEIIPAPIVQSLNLTPEQQTQLRELQRTLDQELSTILTREQRRQLQTSFSQGFPSSRRNDQPDSGRPSTSRPRDRPRPNE